MKKSKVLLLLFIIFMLGFLVIVLVLMNTGAIPTIFKNKEVVKKNDTSVLTNLRKS